MKSSYTYRMIFITVIVIFLIHPGYSQDDGKAFIWNLDDKNLEWGPCPAFMPDGCRITVLQGNPKEYNTDIFFKLPGGTTAPNHWHNSAERMVLISGELHVDYDGQDPVVMKSGTYAYGPAKAPHTAECVSNEPCILFIAFEEPIDAIATEDEGY